ncbi:hypothetical protein CY35_12G059100 [Sphagnum magellanicum]|nr:hypothetical protein CY35_12G059100 [Sphagnum magellanicum]
MQLDLCPLTFGLSDQSQQQESRIRRTMATTTTTTLISSSSSKEKKRMVGVYWVWVMDEANSSNGEIRVGEGRLSCWFMV